MEQYQSEVENTLKLVLSASESIQIQAATDVLHQQAFKDERCISALTFIIQQSPHKEVRQLAAVELRKQTLDWWTKLALEVKSDVKFRLLEVIVNEPEPFPRHATARVIATIGRMEIPVQSWPQLVPFVLKCCNSPIVGHREAGLYLISTIFEVTDALTDDLCEPLRLFSMTIQDPESLMIRATTVVAIGKMSSFISTLHVEEIKLLQDLIPHMVQVLGQCVTSNEESQALKCFDIMEELLKLVISSLVPHLKDFVEFFLHMAASTTVQPKMRVHAISVLSWAVLQKSAKIEQLGLLDSLIKTLLAIGTEDGLEDLDEDSPARNAFSLLHTVGIHMSFKAVFVAARPNIQDLVTSTDARYRKAGVMALGVLAEGCAEIMRPDVPVLLQVIGGALEDPERTVRLAACVALCAFADQFEEEVLASHANLVPKLLGLLNVTTPDITEKACNALDTVILQLENDFQQYFPMAMERLLILTVHVQGAALIAVITVIASAARVSHGTFLAYFESAATRLRSFMSVATNEDDLKIRSAATDAMRDVVDAVGKDVFRPYLHDCMVLAMEGVLKDNTRLHECGYHFFATAAQVFEAEFSPYLSEIVPHVVRSCSLQDQIKKEDVVEEDLADLDEEETEEDVNLAFNCAVAQEKEIASGTLAALFEHTREAFFPYLEHSIKVLVDLLDDKSDAVRKAGISGSFSVLRTLHRMSSVTPWRADLPRASLQDNVRELCEILIPVIYSLWLSEHDKMVVVLVCQELAETLRCCGPAILFDSLPDVCQQLKLVFEKKAYFQQSIINEENLLDEDEDDENDTVLICAAADLVSTLATVHGCEFVPYAKIFIPFIMKYYKKTKTPSERSTSMGCLGEITVAIGPGITEFTDKILQLVQKALCDQDDEVRSNAAFAVGVLCENTTVDMSSNYPSLLQSLYPLFHDQALVNVTDNACGAVSRMIMKYPQVVPVEQVLPTLIQELPLKAELEENEPVFRFLLTLIQARNGWVLEHLAQIFGLFGEALSKDSKLSESTRQEMLEMIRAFDYQLPAELSTNVAHR